MIETILFDGFQDLARVALSALLIYVGVIVAVRLAGKRSTSQMNNFDWVVTVAMGSIAGSGILVKDVTVLEVYLAIAGLLSLQWVVTKLVVLGSPITKLVKAEPALLFHDGEFLREAMRRERVTEAEITAAIRQDGLISLDAVRMVVLETDANLSVVKRDDRETAPTAIQGVSGFAATRTS